jgi:hypothetical protein
VPAVAPQLPSDRRRIELLLDPLTLRARHWSGPWLEPPRNT